MPVHSGYPPILFVHGNGDNASVWMTTIWRYESNGWPADRLFAGSLPYPNARDDDTVPQAGRSSADDYRRFIAAEVDDILRKTGASQVVLIGSSRGANQIRNYIEHDAGWHTVSFAILAGGTSHGVFVSSTFRPGSEFNGAGPLLSGLNAPQGPYGDEVTSGPKWLTLRSDKNDKYAQPDGAVLGFPGVPTHITADGPALKGAENIVLPGEDHREVAFSAQAFARSYEFLTGHAPATLEIKPQDRVTLDGLVAGWPEAGPTNLPLVGARVEVYAVDADSGARQGRAVIDKTIGPDGHWGPLRTDSRTSFEFAITAEGFATMHIYHPPFARSSAVVDLRVERLPSIAQGEAPEHCVVSLVRARGYLGIPRDRVELDGVSPAPGVPAGVPTAYQSTAVLHDCANRSVTGRFNDQVITGKAWPLAGGHYTQLEVQE